MVYKLGKCKVKSQNIWPMWMFMLVTTIFLQRMLNIIIWFGKKYQEVGVLQVLDIASWQCTPTVEIQVYDHDRCSRQDWKHQYSVRKKGLFVKPVDFFGESSFYTKMISDSKYSFVLQLSFTPRPTVCRQWIYLNIYSENTGKYTESRLTSIVDSS